MGALVFLLHEQILQGIETAGSLILEMSIREDVEILLEGSDGCHRGALVQSRLRSILEETLAHVILGVLCIATLRIGREILLEILRCSLVILHAELSHGKHIETFLALGRALLHGNEFLQERYDTGILALSITLLGILILQSIITRFGNLVIFVHTAGHQQCYA